jgi:RNA polymerase sigma-70 factor (ECF subfamily)
MDDGSLLAAIANGSESELRELFDRHAPWLAMRLRRLLPIDAVEDVVQETFVAIWKGSAGYAGRGEAGAWIWGIARRQAAMWLRANGRTEAALDDASELAIDDHAPATMRRLDLAQALASLDGGDELVRAVYIEEKGLDQVAGKLGIPVGTVKSRLFHARRRLRAMLLGEEQ